MTPFGSGGGGLDAEKKAQLRKIMEEEMSSVVQKVIDASPPVAQGGMQTGVKRIQAEVNRVFQPIRSEWFSDVVSQGQWEPVAAYRFVFRNKRLEDAFNRRQLDVLDRAFNDQKNRDSNVTINWGGQEPNPALHLQQRGADGQVMPNNVVYHVSTKRSITKYAVAVAKSVGKMVSGWYQVMNKLGKSVKSPFPGQGKGDVSFTETGSEYTLQVSNELGNFNGMLPRFTQPQQLISAAAKACESRWMKIAGGGNDPAKGLMGMPSAPMTTPKSQIASRTIMSAQGNRNMRDVGTPKEQAAAQRAVYAVGKFLANSYANMGTGASVYAVTAMVGPVVSDKSSSMQDVGKKLVEHEKAIEELQKLKGPELVRSVLGGYSSQGGFGDRLQTMEMLQGFRDD